MSVSRTVVTAAGMSDSVPHRAVPAQSPLVLVVEDDACVADVVEHLLVRHGHRVLRAADGAEASRRFAEHERELALAMIDCGLPDIDGVSLARVLRKLAPDLPIVLTSGWDSVAARALAAHGPTVFLQKPFFPADVLRTIRNCLALRP